MSSHTLRLLSLVTIAVLLTPQSARSQDPVRILLEELDSKGLAATLERRRIRIGTKRERGESTVESAGNRLLEQGRVGQALMLLRFNVLSHPKRAAGYRSLGLAYEKSGQLIFARAELLRALSLTTPAGHHSKPAWKADLKRINERIGGREKNRATRRGSRRERHVRSVLDVAAGQIVADIGCGSGWLAVAIAKAVGPGGKVYAVEISRRSLEIVRKRGIPNIVPVLSTRDDVKLPAHSIDVAYLHDVASHVARKARRKFYASLARALVPDGRLVVFGAHGHTKKYLEEFAGFGFHLEEGQDLEGLTGKALDKRYLAGLRFRYRGRTRL